MKDTLSIGVEFEKAVRLLAAVNISADVERRKPALFHDIRVGVYLYQRQYSRDIILAGLLHDSLEWYGIRESDIRSQFGDRVADLVRACTKDDSIKDPKEKIQELIKRCVTWRQDALIIKTADIIDSFQWYTATKNENELRYCMRNADAIFAYKPADWNDPILGELERWRGECTVSSI